MVEARIIHSLAQTSRDAWDRCFPGALETYDFLLAVERANLPGFAMRYGLVERDRALIAAAPAFLTQYSLETTLGATAKHLVAEARRLWPSIFKLRLGCLGSPCTETASLGFTADISAPEKPALTTLLMKCFEREAAREGAGLFAVKDAPVAEDSMWLGALSALGYHGVPSMPTAQLDIDFDSEETYLARLSAATRKDMRRKLRSFADVRIETRSDVNDVADSIARLYAQTLERADFTFEELPASYFVDILRLMPGRAFCTLYFSGEALLAFNLLLKDETTLLDKFFCMSAEQGRALNLYFLSWFTNVRLCLAHGLKRYQSGQAGYPNKLRLGSRLEPTRIYFRHRNPLLNRALRTAAPLFLSDPKFSPSAA